MALNAKPKGLVRPTPANDAEDDARFERALSGASDYKGEPEKTPERARRKRKKPITFTVDEEMIERLDSLARRRGMSRASVMILAFSEHLEANKA